MRSFGLFREDADFWNKWTTKIRHLDISVSLDTYLHLLVCVFIECGRCLLKELLSVLLLVLVIRKPNLSAFS